MKSATRQKHVPLNRAVTLNRPVYDENSLTVEDMLAADEPSPEDQILDNEDHEELMRLIETTLSPYERALVRHYLKGKSFHEIATACGTHVKSVDNALWRVKCKLKRYGAGLSNSSSYAVNAKKRKWMSKCGCLPI